MATINMRFRGIPPEGVRGRVTLQLVPFPGMPEPLVEGTDAYLQAPRTWEVPTEGVAIPVSPTSTGWCYRVTAHPGDGEKLTTYVEVRNEGDHDIGNLPSFNLDEIWAGA